MPVSVIVMSYNSPRTPERCLESPVRQPEAAEIVVVDCSPVNPAASLASRFPRTRFLHFEKERSVPAVRWAAFGETREDLVAAVEAGCVPASDWCARIETAHAAFPEAPAIGGSVAVAEGASARDLGLYFCEYGLYVPPAQEGITRDLSGANLSYKRAALLESRDLLGAGKWETFLHERWQKKGRWPRLSYATVVFHNTMPLATALRQRFWLGRGYAAERVAGRSPLLPFIFILRMWVAGKAKGLLRQLLRAIGSVFVFNAAWAMGECCGYLFRRPARPRIF
jgi:hypothetical protein